MSSFCNRHIIARNQASLCANEQLCHVKPWQSSCSVHYGWLRCLAGHSPGLWCQVAPCLLLPHGTCSSKATAGCPPTVPVFIPGASCTALLVQMQSVRHAGPGGCSLCHEQATFIQEPMKHERVWASIIALIKTENHILHSSNYFKEQTKCRGMNRLNEGCNYGAGRTTAPRRSCRARLFGQHLGAVCCPPIPMPGDTRAPHSTSPSPAQLNENSPSTSTSGIYLTTCTQHRVWVECGEQTPRI